jgi:hypothetical protein
MKSRLTVDYPPLTEEQRKLCPFGEEKCKICQLPPKVIQQIHDARLKDGVTYTKIQKMLKTKLNLKVSTAYIGNHINHHVQGKEVTRAILAKKDKEKNNVTKALEPITEAVKITTSTDIEKAYESLVKMAHTYTKRIQKVQDLLEDHLDKRKSEDIEEEFEAQNMQSLLEKQAKLNKEAREFVKEVSALRAPKVMVAQFLESFIDDTIKEVSVLLGNLAEGLHHDLNEELTEAGYNTLDSEMYKKVFRNLALEYRDRMINLKRQHMSSALSALQDLEKII